MFLLIQIIFSIAVSAFALECPPSKDVHPCLCEEIEDMIQINCKGFNSLAELEPVVRNTVGYGVSFKFLNSNLGDIPSNFFEGHKSTQLHFEQCVISSFGDRPFSGLEDTLENLYIYASIDKSVTKMDSFKLNHLKKLEYISIANNDISELGNDFFENGPESLLFVVLIRNQIEKVGDKAFASLVNLEQLYVEENQIKAVARSMLPNPSNNLWFVNAKSNEIEELPTDTFEGFPELAVVNLQQNKLKSIPENVWGKIWSQLESVHLEGNAIVCDDNLKWIYTQKLPSTFDGKCGPGNDLANRDLNSLKLEDFQ